MKLKIAFASASVLVLSACGTSPEALQALQSMQILENNSGAGISYEKLSGSGNDVTLTGIAFKAPASVMAMMADEEEGGEHADHAAHAIDLGVQHSDRSLVAPTKVDGDRARAEHGDVLEGEAARPGAHGLAEEVQEHLDAQGGARDDGSAAHRAA